MSEIHWKIREKIYESVNSENIGLLANLMSSGNHLRYVLGQFDSLRSFVHSESVRTAEQPYSEYVDLDVSRKQIRRWELTELSQNRSSDDSGGLPFL